MAMENDVLTRELNAYIRKNLRPEGVKLQDILDINIRHATAPGLGGAKWALDFLVNVPPPIEAGASCFHENSTTDSEELQRLTLSPQA